MLSFKPDPVSHFVLTPWGGLCNVVEGLKGCGPVFFNQLVSCSYSFVVSNRCGFFCCTCVIPQ